MGEGNKRTAADEEVTESISLTTTENIKNLLERAAEVAGLSLNAYVVESALKGAENTSVHRNNIEIQKPGGFGESSG